MLNCFGPVRSGENIIGSVRGRGNKIYYFSVRSGSGQKITGQYGIGVPKTLPRRTLLHSHGISLAIKCLHCLQNCFMVCFSFMSYVFWKVNDCFIFSTQIPIQHRPRCTRPWLGSFPNRNSQCYHPTTEPTQTAGGQRLSLWVTHTLHTTWCHYEGRWMLHFLTVSKNWFANRSLYRVYIRSSSQQNTCIDAWTLSNFQNDVIPRFCNTRQHFDCNL